LRINSSSRSNSAFVSTIALAAERQPPPAVEREVAHPQDLVVVAGARPAHQRPEPGQQLVEGEGLLTR
jgi:hypothetical protein